MCFVIFNDLKHSWESSVDQAGSEQQRHLISDKQTACIAVARSLAGLATESSDPQQPRHRTQIASQATHAANHSTPGSI